ncbi:MULTISPECIES: DUF742 domain-containing protein [Streptomyces]|uniref:DUF742 domain-containing protein n=1 Tax=Streptomyces yunnanensis TaxID=156453 RepID=A0ABY8A315_9ACTN|nr:MULTISPECIES: DUF742 domain-containing protein [Streptomyces]AJC54559.1 DUF742 domain-containing protein [Streptomyces sp. 769]WEB39337.1 DUF742 domain-containing protein [Streptomyces yunnanensis]
MTVALPRRQRSPGPDAPWVDDVAGRLVRPYTVSRGRTRPTAHFDLMTMVRATGRRPAGLQGPDYDRVLGLCYRPVPVAEVAAHVRLPAVVTKVLLADLVDCGALTARTPSAVSAGPAPRTDRALLEAVLHGLRQRL